MTLTGFNEYLQLNATGIVDEDDASLQIIPNKHGVAANKDYDLYLYVEKIVFSVYKAAVGGAGLCTIQSNEADIIWTLNVDEIKDVTVDWGDEGIKVGTTKDVGLQAVLSGGDTQASVSIGVTAHYDKD